MKAAPFTFHHAEGIEHALALLAAHGGDCKPIAGGQSLVPMMAMRLARPAVLLDVNRLEALRRAGIVERIDADEARTRDLVDLGYRVLRYWNDDALLRTQDVLDDILRYANSTPPQPSPSLREREGE